MPLALPTATQAALQGSLRHYAGAVSDNLLTDLLDRLRAGLDSILNPAQVEREPGALTVTEGATPPSLRSDLEALLRRFGGETVAEEMNLDFKIEVARKVAQGAGRYVAQLADVDEYPALELYRLYDRDVPRGFETARGGGLVEVPGDDWASRFRDACGAAGDADALRVLEETGRMIALKNSGVWPELGTNRDDTLGNPYPPFAFNSGYDVDGVPRNECVALGLLAADETPAPADFDPFNLLSLPEAA